MTAAAVAPSATVYAMHMYNERIQLLASKEQRGRWEREARRRDVSLSSMIRDAVDAQLGGISREDKIAAAEAIAAIEGLPPISVEELQRLLEEAYDEEVMRGIPMEPPR
jgi:hypothetical protein